MKKEKNKIMPRSKKYSNYTSFEDLIITDSMISEHVRKHSRWIDRLIPYRMASMTLYSLDEIYSELKNGDKLDDRSNWKYKFINFNKKHHK